MRNLSTLLILCLAGPAAAQTLVIGNKGENSVSFVDLPTGRERARAPTGPMPHEVAICPDGRHAAVVAYGGNTIDLFEVATGRRIDRFDLGANRRPHGLLWLSDGRLLATAEGSDTLAVVGARGTDGTRRVSAIPTGQEGSHMVAASRDLSRAYVANMRSATVGVFDLARGTKLRDVAVGTEPEGVALSDRDRRLWVTDRPSNTVHVFDTATMRRVATLRTGAFPIRVTVSPDGRTAVTSNHMDGTLSLFDVATLKPTRTIRVGDKASAQVTILFSADSRRLYVAETGRDTVAEVEAASGRVLRRLPAGRQGDGLAISPVTTRPAR